MRFVKVTAATTVLTPVVGGAAPAMGFPKSITLRLFGMFLAVTLAFLGLPAVTASAQSATEPKIAFLNPSGFATRTGVGILVSDTTPSRPVAGRSTYRLSAWTSGATSGAGVEFELFKSGVSLETIEYNATASLDTFEADWNISDALPDGSYTLRATLFSDNEAVTTVDQDIVLARVAERATINYPTLNGAEGTPADGSFGTYAALATELPEKEAATRRLPVGNIDASHTGAAPGTGTSYVRAFYTVSSPGSVPEWIECGTEGAPGSATLSSHANDGIRCTLQDPAHQTAVTAVAAVPNSAQGAFDPAMNGVGDATRVTEAYAQTPAALALLPGSSGETIPAGDDGEFKCHVAKVHLEDDRGREVAGANLDVNASGPNDKLRFDRGPLAPKAQAPDRQSHATEAGHDCLADTSRVGDQAEHQILGGPDIKHLETLPAGSDDSGNWSFGLWTPGDSVTPGRVSARFTAWLDEGDDGCLTNDDRFSVGEMSVSGVVGFGSAPPSPEPFAASDPVLCTPPIADEPPTDEPGPREITLVTDQTIAQKGSRLRVTGTISSAYSSCLREQSVKVKRRRPGYRFKTVAEVVSDGSGSFTARVPVRGGANDYRAVAVKTDSCLKARSEHVRVRGY